MSARRPLSIHLDPDLVMRLDLAIAALSHHVSRSNAIEIAIEGLLERGGLAAAVRGPSEPGPGDPDGCVDNQQPSS